MKRYDRVIALLLMPLVIGLWLLGSASGFTPFLMSLGTTTTTTTVPPTPGLVGNTSVAGGTTPYYGEGMGHLVYHPYYAVTPVTPGAVQVAHWKTGEPGSGPFTAYLLDESFGHLLCCTKSENQVTGWNRCKAVAPYTAVEGINYKTGHALGYYSGNLYGVAGASHYTYYNADTNPAVCSTTITTGEYAASSDITLYWDNDDSNPAP